MIAGQVQDKIPCLFKTQFNEITKENLATHELRNEVITLFTEHTTLTVKATIKFDGTCSLIRNGQLYRRYDRKLNKQGQAENRKLQKLIKQKGIESVELKFNIKKHYKEAPNEWIPADGVIEHLAKEYHDSQHIVGWIPVSLTDKVDAWHASTLIDRATKVVMLQPNSNDDDPLSLQVHTLDITDEKLQNRTVELIGSKVNGNPYLFPSDEKQHFLVGHGSVELPLSQLSQFTSNVNDLRTVQVDQLIHWFKDIDNIYSRIEGIVWHVFDEQENIVGIFKVHRNHMGLGWPIPNISPAFAFKNEWLTFN
jgi:hypothetical protein